MNIKYIYFAILAILIAGALYLVFNQQSSIDNKLPIVKKDTPTNQPIKPVSQSNKASEKDVIDDSKKELPKTTIETEKQKSSTVTEHKELQKEAVSEEFKIDTSWQSRSIYRNNIEVFYSFGAGNPPEVSLSQNELEKLQDQIKSIPMNHTTYMNTDAEWAMKEFLENQNLITLLDQCGSKFSLSKKDLSMESILYIDKDTGRKEFNTKFIEALGDGLTNLNSPMKPDEWKNCIGENNKFIYDSVVESFSKVIKNYILFEKEVSLEIPKREVTSESFQTTPPDGYNRSTPSD